MTLVHTLITIGVSYRVIKVRLPVATSLTWLILVFFLPLLDAVGSARFLKGRLVEQLRAGGVEVALFINCCCCLFIPLGRKL